MERFKLLLSVMILYENNFRNLHWNSAGEEFDNAHKEITTEYYELYSKNIDKVAEIMAQFGINPPNAVEAVFMAAKNEERNFLVVDSESMFRRRDIVVAADQMLRDTCVLLSEVLDIEPLEDSINAGLKSSLESILEEFTLQYRYINKRKLIQ